MLRIDHTSPVPLRAQVEQLLRELALKPDYQKGALLPDEVALAAQLGVSRKAGVGTRVSDRNLESGITAWRSFTREMASKGIIVKNLRLDYRQVKASADAARALNVDLETPLWCLDRVRGWDGEPVLQSTSWFHPRVALKGNEDTSCPLYEMIEKAAGVRPKNAREEFLAVGADARLARLLNVTRNTALLLRRHTVFDQGNRPFEFAEVHYVSSRFALTLNVRRGGS
jgi:GntR family transcriptional regulator